MLKVLRMQCQTRTSTQFLALAWLWHSLLLTAEDNERRTANDIENEQLDEMRDVLAATKTCKWLTRGQQ